jgi:hypothetical protein
MQVQARPSPAAPGAAGTGRRHPLSPPCTKQPRTWGGQPGQAAAPLLGAQSIIAGLSNGGVSQSGNENDGCGIGQSESIGFLHPFESVGCIGSGEATVWRPYLLCGSMPREK